MRIITCASFFCTGSSAITDLFSEFNCVESFGRNEYRFIQDPDGISDLEYNIIDNNNRHNTSHAIKRYKKLIYKLKGVGNGSGYTLYNQKFDIFTNKYINELTELKTKTWWQRDRLDKGTVFGMIDRAYSFVNRLIHGGLHTERRFSLLKNHEYAYYSAISQEAFLTATRRYIDNVVKSGMKTTNSFVMVDQLVPPTNTKRYQRYFNDVKIIVVDRDPRDVYLYERDHFKWGIIPTDNVEEYVKWFRITRKYSKGVEEDAERVLRIQFEDLIYKYEETIDKLIEFVGVPKSAHTKQRTKFIPEKSINNTNLKQKIKGYENQIEFIEKELKEYLYDFPMRQCE